MLLLGLTGSIATGKSTVSNLLRSAPYSLPIIDADVLARKVVEPGTPGYKKILDYFGPTTPDLLLPIEDEQCGGNELGKDGKGRPLNRPALGRRVFGSEEDKVRDRKMLGSFIHPAVGKEIYKAIVRSRAARSPCCAGLCAYRWPAADTADIWELMLTSDTTVLLLHNRSLGYNPGYTSPL